MLCTKVRFIENRKRACGIIIKEYLKDLRAEWERMMKQPAEDMECCKEDLKTAGNAHVPSAGNQRI